MSPLVLLVDDDVDILEVLSMVLAAADYRVATATDGQAALDLLKSGPPPSLIVLDLMMPGMDGWTFCERRSENAALAAIPIVVLSANHVALQRYPPLGVECCLRKPIDADTLLDTIGRYAKPPGVGAAWLEAKA